MTTHINGGRLAAEATAQEKKIRKRSSYATFYNLGDNAQPEPLTLGTFLDIVNPGLSTLVKAWEAGRRPYVRCPVVESWGLCNAGPMPMDELLKSHLPVRHNVERQAKAKAQLGVSSPKGDGVTAPERATSA
jgi:hypothetical protein